ncbi:MAG: hypothetical protein GY749_46615 [Desulfobacteraceae bacterium]|nr:hypothetical protein [Desulfobacteraceae bacterium]
MLDTEESVAPAWSLKKGETLTLIKETLEKRDSWQGKLFPGIPVMAAK